MTTSLPSLDAPAAAPGPGAPASDVPAAFRSAAGAGSPLPATRGPSLSPSRAADFKTCPLLFRFRTIDRLPEQPSRDQVRGTLVHAVLERLFDLPAAGRTPEAAVALVQPEWERLVAQEPELAALFDDASGVPVPVVDRPLAGPSAGEGAALAGASGLGTSPGSGAGAAVGSDGSGAAVDGAGAGEADGSGAAGGGDAIGGTGAAASGGAASGGGGTTTGAEGAAGGGAVALPGMPEPVAADDLARLERFLQSAGELLAGYFEVEDPTRLEPAERESLISTLVGDDLLIRGYIDRLDVSPAGDLRVVDYKTGGAPREAFEGRALFQLKFYALVLWRTRGVVPRVLRLLYLKDQEVLDYSPDAEELERFERTLLALSRAIETAKQQRDFRPKPSRLCGWCSHQQFCPEFGGTPPPFPDLIALAPTPPADHPTPATDGHTTDAHTADGSATDGHTAGGRATDGHSADGSTADGHTANASTADGTGSDGRDPRSDSPGSTRATAPPPHEDDLPASRRQHNASSLGAPASRPAREELTTPQP